MPIKITAFLKSFWGYLYPRRCTIIALLIIGLIGLLSVSWFRGDYLISATDFSMPLNRIRSFTANFYFWDSRSLGSANPRILALTFPVWTYFAFSEIIGVSVINAEKILFYGVFTISGLSMYYLTTTLINTRTAKFKRLAGLISGLFYMLNPYVAINILPLRQVSYIIYALLPLIFGIFVKGLTEKRNIRFAIIAAFVMLLPTSVYVDPSFIPFTFLPLLLYLIFFILTNPKKTALFSAFKFSVALVVTWILLNLYWLIPDVYSFSNEFEKVASAYSSLGVSFQSIVQLNSAPILGAIRLLGYWGLNSGYKGAPYFIWASAYQNPLLIVISFLIPILAFTPALLKPKDKHVLFFTSFAIISLLLVNGSNSPVGNWIYSHIPLFGALFNTPYLRFGMYIVLAYAFLIGYALTEISSRLTTHLKKTRYLRRQIISGIPIVLILFLIVGVYAFPLWTGDVIRPGTQVLQSNRYQMPPYYQTASDWLGSDPSDFKILVLPISTIGNAELKWTNGGYDGPYPADWLFPKAVITSSTAGNGIAGIAAQLIINNQTTAASKILALMNVKYVLFQGDTNWLYVENNPSWISTSPEQFQSILSSSGVFTLEKTFGQLVFYKNNYWQPVEVYSVSTSILSDGNVDQLIQIAERNDFTPSGSVILLSNQLDAQQISALPMNTVFVQNLDLNLTYNPVSGVQNDGRIVYVLNSQPFATASYYSGWKGVVSTNGQGDPGMIVFSSPSECSYLSAFSKNFTSWNAYSSTLIYVTTSSSPLTINSITVDGVSVTAAAWAWWQTGTSWITGWPITIPSNQNAIIQMNQQASNITLQTNNGPIALSVTDGWKNPLTTENLSEIPTTIVTPNAGDYLLAINVATGYGYGNLSVKVDDQSFSVDLNSQEQGPVFTYKYIGPIHLTAGSHTITTSEGNVSIPQINGMLLYSLKNGESFVNTDNLLSSNQQNNASITYEEINPTQYTVHVNSSSPFYLIFSESYDNGWIATINGQQIPSQYHFTANGYANGWYINKTGTYTITLEFTPQNLFYAGAAISITTLIICTIYISKNKIKIIYQKYLKKNRITTS